MAVIDIYNEKQLRQAMLKLGDDISWGVKNAVVDHLSEETKRTVYSETPVVYQRTYQFLNSITSDHSYKNGSFAYRIFFDPNRMAVSTGIFKKNIKGKLVNVTYGKHANNKGQDVRDKLVMYLEEGIPASNPVAYTTEGKRAGLHMYRARPGNHMIKNTNTWLRNSLVPMVVELTSSVCDNKIVVYN